MDHEDVEDELFEGPYDEEDLGEDDRSSLPRVLAVVLAVVVGLGLVVALGTTLVVRSLGLDEGGTSTGAAGQASSNPVDVLPSSALPVPGGTASPGASPSGPAAPSRTPRPKAAALVLQASPTQVRPLGRIDLTGTYRGPGTPTLQVQRREGGGWSDFPVQATVRGGTFATYVQTGRGGSNRFRVVDPRTGKASNAVTVAVG